MFQMAKKTPGTLFLSYTLATISLVQGVWATKVFLLNSVSKKLIGMVGTTSPTVPNIPSGMPP